MRTLLALVLAAFVTVAQDTRPAAVMTFAPGITCTVLEGSPVTFTPPGSRLPLQAVLSQDHLEIWNPGLPDNFGGSSQMKWTPEPVFFSGVEVSIPEDRTILLASLARYSPHAIAAAAEETAGSPTSPGLLWKLAGPDDPKHFHSRALTQPVYGRSLSLHMLDGGDRFYVRFAPAGDPFETALAPQKPQLDRALAIEDFDPVRSADPRLRRILGFYTFTAESLNRSTKQINRNFGWFAVPENFAYRWTSQSQDRVAWWYGVGDLHSPSEGPSNCHYNHDAHALEQYLLTGDPVALMYGLTMVRHKVALGLIDVDPNAPTAAARAQLAHYVGMWRGEKGGMRVGESTPGPVANKQYDRGLVLASILRPDDTIIQRGMQVREKWLLSIDDPFIWNGAGGGRAIGHHLENLWWHWKATGNDAFKLTASRFIDHVFRKNGQNIGTDALWFDNSIRPGWNAVWEEALAHVWIRRWQQEGIAQQHVAHLDAMIGWLLQNGGAWAHKPAPGEPASAGRYMVAFEVSTPDGAQKSFKGGLSGCFWAGLPPSPERDAAVAYTLDQINPMTWCVDEQSLGPSSEKWQGMLAEMVRRSP